MIHKPQPQLNILTPLPDIAPFTEQSINKAFNFWVNPQNWVLGQKLLAINFDLNQVLFTWAFDESFKSSFILVYTCKGQFFNNDLDQDAIQHLMEESFLSDDELSGDGEVDYTFNGITLVITIKHQYSI